MNRSQLSALIAVTGLLCLLAGGCTPTPPPLTDAEGIVTLNGEPLPYARVVFAPELDRFGAEMNSVGITDEKGQFKLTCMFKSEPGAVVASHKVMITEGPPPAETRGPSQEAQERLTRYQAGLKNRPIPQIYATYSSTPITIEVKADQKSYTIQLTRVGPRSS
jgi:hypothetical protein